MRSLIRGLAILVDRFDRRPFASWVWGHGRIEAWNFEMCLPWVRHLASTQAHHFHCGRRQLLVQNRILHQPKDAAPRR